YIIPDGTTFPDLMPDVTPPSIVSTSPADGEGGVPVPFTIRITFSEPLYAVTVGAQTVVVTAAGDKKISGEYTLEGEGEVVVFTPTSAVFHSSPYKVTIGPMLSDPAGNKYGTESSFSFFTGPHPDMGSYATLAATYSPVIYGETSPGYAKYDVPTRFDIDGDWNGGDTVSYMQTEVQSITPTVYYSVVESKSHWFITYAYFWPYRYEADAEARFGNDMAGAVVTVRKHDGMPVFVDTYHKHDTSELSDAYVSDAFDLVPLAANPLDYRFEDRFPTDVLFPNGHFEAYLSAGKHESCLWQDRNNTWFDGCLLNPGLIAQMEKIQYVYGAGEPDVLQKSGASWPTNLQGVKYELIPLLETFWARRDQYGPELLWDVGFPYEHFQGRPALTTDIPGTFTDPVGNDNGRPPWAWKWQPGNGETFYDIARGAMILDPAAYFSVRHNTDISSPWPAWDPGTGAGWSYEYCFNPYFNLDFRTLDPECAVN
ncbi:MAG: Ig-like domain-containing protein, partial [Deltaproteobacteria bacterium]|nr:Ig-like domain-containing protein [Deltaproteobacteria bacterium]